MKKNLLKVVLATTMALTGLGLVSVADISVNPLKATQVSADTLPITEMGTWAHSYSANTLQHNTWFKTSSPLDGTYADWNILNSNGIAVISGTTVNYSMITSLTYQTPTQTTNLSNLPAGTYKIIYSFIPGNIYNYTPQRTFIKSASGAITVY